MVCVRCTIDLEIVLDTPDGTRLKWKLVSVLSKIVLILTEDRCIMASNVP
jgi:hypothetical protein